MKLGAPLTARYASYEPDFPEQKKTAAQKAGLAYERAVLKKLGKLHTKVEVGPWLYYKSPQKSGICQPDGLVWLPRNRLCVVEVKLSWKAPARQKLLEFYGPIVQAIYPAQELCFLQIYKNTKKAAHKKTLSIYDIADIEVGKYRECQWLGL